MGAEAGEGAEMGARRRAQTKLAPLSFLGGRATHYSHVRIFPPPHLAQHDFVISGVDWCAATNRIVTVSHDRNAFVWNFEPAAGGAANAGPPGGAGGGGGGGAQAGTWKPQVVVLNINRAALDAKWSPDGERAAQRSGKEERGGEKGRASVPSPLPT